MSQQARHNRRAAHQASFAKSKARQKTRRRIQIVQSQGTPKVQSKNHHQPNGHFQKGRKQKLFGIKFLNF